jgi:predicted PurR-regulated permease PerM
MHPFDLFKSAKPQRTDRHAPASPGDAAEGAPGAKAARHRAVRLRQPPSVTISLAVLAVLGVLALLRYAGSVFITVFSSILIAIALEPLVRMLDRKLRLPRHTGSMVVVFLAIGSLYGIFYLAYAGAQGFLADLPALADKIRTAPIIEAATEEMRGLERGFDAFTRGLVPPAPAIGKVPQVVVSQDHSLAGTLFSGLGSITTIVFSLSFIPFLVYFILAEKDSLTRRTLALFPGQEQQVRTVLTEIEEMMQTFLVGNAIIAGILSAMTIVLFWAAGLPYWLVLGTLSGILSTVPYLGLVLALAPGLIVGLVSFESGLPLLVIVTGVTAFHLIAANYLIPRFVGGRTHLNAVSSTLSILFFGWMWGGMGLLLAIPIAAVLRSALGSNPATAPLGRWLGDEDP